VTDLLRGVKDLLFCVNGLERGTNR